MALNPLLIFGGVLMLTIVAGAASEAIRYFEGRSASRPRDLSGELPTPSPIFGILKVLLVIAILTAPFYVFTMMGRTAADRSGVKLSSEAQCRLKLGPYQKKWTC